MKIRNKKVTPDYKKISEELEKIMYNSAFRCNGSSIENQVPILIDIMSYFLATCDGNAFTMVSIDDDKKHHNQYNSESAQIISLGIKAFMEKNGFNKAIYNDDFGYKKSLEEAINFIENTKMGE